MKNVFYFFYFDLMHILEHILELNWANFPSCFPHKIFTFSLICLGIPFGNFWLRVMLPNELFLPKTLSYNVGSRLYMTAGCTKQYIW